MTDDVVLTERREHLLVVTLNRPEVRNAIDEHLVVGLTAAVELLDGDDGLRIGVLAGAGGAFCAGMDLRAFARSGTPRGIYRLLRAGSRKPLVAAVEGPALGGGLELALLCDLIVAAEGATLGIPEARVGLFAGGGGLLRLPQRAPCAVASEMAFTAMPLTAERALAAGLVSRVAPDGGALGAAVELATAIAANAPLAVAASKRLLVAQRGMSEAEFWDHQTPVADAVFRSRDAREGPRAFAEKRPPRWTGA